MFTFVILITFFIIQTINASLSCDKHNSRNLKLCKYEYSIDKCEPEWFCLFSHCSNTNKFISCQFVNGDIKLIENNCPKGLVWNNSRKECLMNHKKYINQNINININ